MALVLDLPTNLPSEVLYELSGSMNVPIHRIGAFHRKRTTDGCGQTCIWNGAGYYAEPFTCGQVYESRRTFYCSEECRRPLGTTRRVFLSYRWRDSEIADHITTYCRGAGLELLRDVREMEFLDRISDFMELGGESRFFVAVISDTYFLSRHCVFEFAELTRSPSEIRTIPIVLGSAATESAEAGYRQHWRQREQQLAGAISGVAERHRTYLEQELDLVRGAPDTISSFLSSLRSAGLPAGDHWLDKRCRHLIGVVAAALPPTSAEATNWTSSNPRVGQRAAADDWTVVAGWDPGPCTLHIHSHDLDRLDALPWRRDVVHRIADESAEVPTDGRAHVVALSHRFLASMPLCSRLVELERRDDVLLVPWFVDVDLEAPTGEVHALRYWTERLHNTADVDERRRLDEMLSAFGPAIVRLRDTLVPSGPMG